MKRHSTFLQLAFWCAILLSTSSSAQEEGDLVRGADGRVSYVVELDWDAPRMFSNVPAALNRFPSYAQGKVINLVLAMEAQHGVHAERLTSWSSVSFTAYLTEDQAARLAKDPRVTNVIQDRYSVFSSDTTAVWSDVTLGTGEKQGWGKRAVDQAATNSSGSSIVYVVDGGVGRHSDLNVVEWVFANGIPNNVPIACGPRLGTTCTDTQWTWMVNCVPHATAVAGIIGAKANGVGMQGINPSASIVSVSVFSSADRSPDFTHHCYGAVSAFPGSDVKGALDWVLGDVQAHPGARPSVVSLSLNGPPSSYWVDMFNLGQGNAFVVQSAGNNFAFACPYSYSPNLLCAQSTSDGVMVVGAINNHGQPVVPLNGLPGFWEMFGAFLHETGSNFGSQLEWEPGENIYTTYGGNPGPSGGYLQDSRVTYSYFGYVSGTSFASPHLSGLASYLIETTPSLASGAAVEFAIASHRVNLGSYVPSGAITGGVVQPDTSTTVKMPTLSPPGSPSHTAYADLVIARAASCFAPPFGSASGTCSQLPLVGTNGNYAELPNAAYARNNNTLTRTANAAIWLSLDSYGGVGNCNLDAAEIPWVGAYLYASGDRYYGASLTAFPTNVNGGYWTFFSPNCPSASVQLNY